jgi:hypothetical protein
LGVEPITAAVHSDADIEGAITALGGDQATCPLLAVCGRRAAAGDAGNWIFLSHIARNDTRELSISWR